MALHYNLPVYKASYDLLVAIFEFSKQLQRDYKYTLGEALKKETVEMMTNIYRANSRRDKIVLLEKSRENIEVIRLYLRLMKDLKQISLPRFVEINENIESISKQLTAWMKSQKK